MAKHLVPIAPGGMLHDEFFAPNDASPSPTGMQKVAQALNFVSCTQKKLILLRAQNALSPVLGTAGSSHIVWPHIFRTGENTTEVIARIGIAPPRSPRARRRSSAGTSTSTLPGPRLMRSSPSRR
jgi:hypothetical protein